MESQPLTDDAIRHAEEEAQIQQELALSRQPTAPLEVPTGKSTTAASAARPTQHANRMTQMKQHKLAQAIKQKQPPDIRFVPCAGCMLALATPFSSLSILQLFRRFSFELFSPHPQCCTVTEKLIRIRAHVCM